jgi:hypothetical protein
MCMDFTWIKRLLRAGFAVCILLAAGKLLEPHLGLIFIACAVFGVLAVIVSIVLFMGG